MNSKKLIKAIKLLEAMNVGQIIKIEFEDGSGNKFNYDTTDESNKFIDFSKNLHWKLAMIEDKW